MVLVGDTDFLNDAAAVSIQEVFGQRIVVPQNGNLAFAQALVEQVAGDPNLIRLRTRATASRPFTVIREMEARAQQRYLGKIKELEGSLAQAQEKLGALQKQKTPGQAAILSAAQQAELENFRGKAATIRRELKEVRKELRADSEALEFWTKVVNIAAMPILIVLAGLVRRFRAQTQGGGAMTRKQFLILVAALAALAAARRVDHAVTAHGMGTCRLAHRPEARGGTETGGRGGGRASRCGRDAHSGAARRRLGRQGAGRFSCRCGARARAAYHAGGTEDRASRTGGGDATLASGSGRTRRRRPEPVSGTLLELKDGAGKTMTRLLLGKKVTARTDAEGPSPEQGVPTGRYVMPATETGSVVLVSDPLGTAEAKPEAWLSKDLIRAERVRSITVSGPDGKERFSLSRETESYDWKLGGGGKPDLQKAQDALNPLQGMSLSDVVPDPDSAAAGLDRPIVVTAQTLDGVTYTLRVGSKTADDRYFITISVSGEPAAARIAGKTETAEEKQKQDKAFAENRARLVEELAREKKLERWTYLVARAQVEPLLRERAQLLPEKKAQGRQEALIVPLPRDPRRGVPS